MDEKEKQPGQQKPPSESDLVTTINTLIDQRLSALGVGAARKVQIDSAYINGAPKIQRPGDSAPGGSNKTRKVIRAYGVTRVTPSANALAVPVGSDLVVVGEIGDPSASSSELFGDGSDGAGSITSGTTTLTRDTFYATLSVSAGATLATGGWRVFVQGKATIAGTVSNNGGNGGDQGTSGGAAGAAGAEGFFRGAGAGGAGTITTGGNGGSTTAPSAGGNGGNGNNGASTAGTAGTCTSGTDNVWKHHANIAAQMPGAWSGLPPNGATFTSLSGGAGGAAGGGNNPIKGGGGGGGGGVCFLAADTIEVLSGGKIQANGGNGGNGQSTTPGAGSGGGGGGGTILLIHRSFANVGTVQAAGGGTGSNKPGTAGSVGSVVQVSTNQ